MRSEKNPVVTHRVTLNKQTMMIANGNSSRTRIQLDATFFGVFPLFVSLLPAIFKRAQQPFKR
jgi:hypothetical protein